MNSIVDFVSQNPAVGSFAVGAIGMAVIDLVWAINGNLKSNGFLHAFYLLFSGGKEPPQS